MKKSTFLAVILFLFGIFGGTAKTAIPDGTLMRPEKYRLPYKGIDKRPVTEKKDLDSEPWMVVCDNESTYTTTLPGRGERKKDLHFGQHFFVAEEQGMYIRIVKDRFIQGEIFSDHAEDYGWVNKYDMLIWQFSLSNPETRIAAKAIIMNTQRLLDEAGQSRIDYDKVGAYKDPELRNPTDFEARMFDIYYIYKYSRDNGAVLLGRKQYFGQQDFRGITPTTGLVGWVNINRIIEWDHRVAAEPNWNESAIRERQKQGISAQIFSPAIARGNPDQCAKEFIRGNPGSDCHVIWDDDIGLQGGRVQRKGGYYRRPPIIEFCETENIYKLMVMGEARAETGYTLDEEMFADRRRELNEWIAKRDNFNIVFVIDGTTSMGPFYESVINSVQSIVDLFNHRAGEHRELRFGYVVYRDWAHNAMNRMIEQRSLTSNSHEIISLLRRVEADDFGVDPYVEEAVFFGLKEAISELFNDPYETNILIHIGDAGSHSRNDPSYVSLNEVVDLISKFQVRYIAFQAHHMDPHPAYNLFTEQIKEIMQKSSARIYNGWVNEWGSEFVNTYMAEPPAIRQLERNIYRVDNMESMVLIDTDYNTAFNIRDLQNEITRAIDEIESYTTTLAESSREAIEGGAGLQFIPQKTESRYTSSFAAGMYNALLAMGYDKSMIEHLASSSTQLALEGYTSMTHDHLSEPLFLPVLLLHVLEFNRLMYILDQLNSHHLTSSYDKRQNLRNSWIEVLRVHLGRDIEGRYEHISINDAHRMVFGVPSRASILEEIFLEDIHDRDKFPDDQLNRYLRSISFNLTELQNIQADLSYPLMFMSNNIRYYWIDVDLLP